MLTTQVTQTDTKRSKKSEYTHIYQIIEFACPGVFSGEFYEVF